MVYRRNSSPNHPIIQPACSDTSQAGHPIIQPACSDTSQAGHSITHNVGSWQKNSWQWFAVVTRHSITQSSNLPALTPVRQVIQSSNLPALTPVRQVTQSPIMLAVGKKQLAMVCRCDRQLVLNAKSRSRELAAC